MPRPKISIVIPTYNRSGLLNECLHYALTAPPNSEVIVVDNASTDDTSAVVEQFAARDGRVRYLRNDANIGMVPNFNRGMREAQGDYLCVVCDDDLILPGHCEKKAAILDRHPEIAFIYSPWHMIDAHGTSSGTPLGSGMLTYPYIGGRDEFGDLIQNNHIMMNGVLFRRSMLEELGGLDEHPDMAPSPDWEMWLRYSFGRQTAYLPEPSCCVRFHETSHTVESGTSQGAFAKARVNIWRRWLVEAEHPVVLNENIWQRMRALWEQDLNYWFQQDRSKVVPYLEALEAIKQDNQSLHMRRFASGLTSPDEVEPAARSDARPVTNQSAGEKSGVSIRWTANFFDYSGYARLSRDAADALDRAGIRLAIEPEGGSQQFLKELDQNPELLAKWKRLRQNVVNEEISLYFGVPTWWNGTDAFARHREQVLTLRTPGADDDRPRFVGIAMFETDRIPAAWVGACEGMDEVWVPSEFNRDTFAGAGVNPDRLQVVPFGIDASRYDPETVEPLPLTHPAGYTFLSVFQWSRRKGWDTLLDAYFREFTDTCDVCLLIRTYPDSTSGESIDAEIDRFIDERGFDRSRLPAFDIIDDFVSEADMPRLYRAADCFVLPTRGEGWGIPYMEAMASGLPVIATDWSAHRDFMPEDTAYLIPVDRFEPVDPELTSRNPFYGLDHRWAEPSVEETSRLMRHVFQNRNEAKEVGARARGHIRENWTLERTAEWIANRSQILKSADSDDRQSPPTQLYVSGNRSPMHSTPISWSAPLFDPSGYAEEARHFLFALDEAGVPVAAQDHRWSNRIAVLPAQEERRLFSLTARIPGPGGVHISHILPPHFTRRTDAQVQIGRTMFETDRLPDGWADACNRMDFIWVPSEFNRGTFVTAGVDPDRIAVIPGAIDPSPYDPAIEPIRIDGARGFNFLSVFDWSFRKGWDILVRAYVEEFAQDEDVALILKVHSSLGYSTDRIVEQVIRFVKSEMGLDSDTIPDIVFQDGDLPAHLMPRLYRAADCFVLPTRGEGWGRPFMEAMTLGLPTIGTRWSGNTAFMSDSNSLLVDCTVVDVPELAWRETPTFRGHRWAEPNVAHLRELMRCVFTDRDGGRALGSQARDHILAHYSYCQVAAIIQQEVERAISTADSRRAA